MFLLRMKDRLSAKERREYLRSGQYDHAGPATVLNLAG